MYMEFNSLMKFTFNNLSVGLLDEPASQQSSVIKPRIHIKFSTRKLRKNRRATIKSTKPMNTTSISTVKTQQNMSDEYPDPMQPVKYRRQDYYSSSSEEVLKPGEQSNKVKMKPNWGYEPYWPEGNKIFDRISKATTSKDANLVCGKRCPRMYISYGPVCGRNFLYQSKEFDNYCALLNYDCVGDQGWRIVLKGGCADWHPIFPTKYLQFEVTARTLISDFYKLYGNYEE